MYEFWLFVHVLAAVTWVGGALTLNVLGTRMVTSASAPELAGFARRVEWIGTRLFVPASLLLVIAGVIMTIDRWSFDQLWIALGIGGFLYSLINGAFVVGPLSGRTGNLIDERGSEDPEVAGNIRRLLVLARIELGVLVVVVWAMTMKPTL